MKLEIDLDTIIESRSDHSRGSEWWQSTEAEIRTRVNRIKSRIGGHPEAFIVDFGEFQISVPAVTMGAVNSFDLFGLDELILFSFYGANRNRYKVVADLGANIGVHSLILSKLGASVDSYEPDPVHSSIAKRMFSQLDDDIRPRWHEVAVVPDAIISPKVDFVRVKGNTTSSHVLGAKSSPYGELDIFEVSTVSFKEILDEADLVKMDVEGLEAELLESIAGIDSFDCDIVLEVGSNDNAKRVYESAQRVGFQMYSQKLNWERCTTFLDLPSSYKEGSLFLSKKSDMPWGL